ncbi:MAG: malic enzyme, partial [Geminicoccaceae bacterium]|nr:malic enzyme [Geminicoccaceae bacterium]
HTASISSRLLKQLGGGIVIGPLLLGLSKPVQILSMNASVSEMINLAALAAHDAIEDQPAGIPQAAE